MTNQPLTCHSWSRWWRFGFRPALAVVRHLPMAEWRREDISWRVDVAAMRFHARVHRDEPILSGRFLSRQDEDDRE